MLVISAVIAASLAMIAYKYDNNNNDYTLKLDTHLVIDADNDDGSTPGAV